MLLCTRALRACDSVLQCKYSTHAGLNCKQSGVVWRYSEAREESISAHARISRGLLNEILTAFCADAQKRLRMTWGVRASCRLNDYFFHQTFVSLGVWVPRNAHG